MNLSADCMHCLITRQIENISECEDEELKSRYIREVLRTVANAAPEATAPVVVAEISRLHQRMFGRSYSFNELKREYNELLLQRESEIHRRVEGSADPLLSAMKLARAGNYIDFGAMSQIDNEKLDRLLDAADGEELDADALASFRRDLESASSLAYLTDNCGEIVLDKHLIGTIRRLYPGLRVTVVTRGLPVLNDATMEDARLVGLSELTEVIGNGTDVAGTQLDAISRESRERILGADMVVSKGQGNFETLHGCGLNIYYLFLCKCDWFTRRFRMARHKGVFVNERSCPV